MKNQPISELCGIEFYSNEDLEHFLQLNPNLRATTLLQAGPRYILVIRVPNFPTRDIVELFTRDGRHYANFIGPDALEHTYQIRLNHQT